MSEVGPDQETASLEAWEQRKARAALFDELIDFALDGVVSIDEAVAQYKHDLHDIGPDGTVAA